MNANGPAGGNRPSHRSATLEGNRIMQSVPNTPDSNEPAAYAAELDAMSARVLAEGRERYARDAKALARISFLPEPAQTLAYARFAAALLTPRTAGAR